MARWAYLLVWVGLLVALPVRAQQLDDAERDPVQVADEYLAIALAYADYMIEHGRDVYGQMHTPLFVTAINPATGQMFNPPFPHVKRRPFMPGWERDRECRPSDRNNGHADPLDQLALLELLHRLTAITGDERYANAADEAAAWWMANTQTPIGLYPWGSHAHWDVSREAGAGTFEFNHVWPYWQLNTEALHTYAHALWDHVIADQETGDFNRHAALHGHGPGRGKEFPWPGSAMIATWVQAYLDRPDAEYLQAIHAVLTRWESLRDDNGHLAPCSDYLQWAWYRGYMQAANRLDDFAVLIEVDHPELAEQMRDYGRRCDAAFLSLEIDPLDVSHVGFVTSYIRETGAFNPDRMDILGGPWHDRKNYAQVAELFYGRMQRNEDPELQSRYRRAVLDAAELYLCINPEVQWAVWGANMAQAIRLLLNAHELTDNPVYLQRADDFAQLATQLLLDEGSPLPQITSHDAFYEIERVTGDATDAWIPAILDVRDRLLAADVSERVALRVEAGAQTANTMVAGLRDNEHTRAWESRLDDAIASHQGGVWDLLEMETLAWGVELAYGAEGEHALFLSSTDQPLIPAMGQDANTLRLVLSDCITHVPTLEEAMPFNGAYRRRFSGLHREASTAVYGGFKDVPIAVGLVLVNFSEEPVLVEVGWTCHDTWHDRDPVNEAVQLEPGERVLVVCEAPDQQWVRQISITSDGLLDVRLQQLGFVMVSRSELNAEMPAP